MSYALDEIKQKVKQSVRKLWHSDKHLLNVDASERSITHRLAIYIEREFREYNVDCEYNREGNDTKRYREIIDKINKAGISADDTEAKTAFPDIIVHKRGNNRNNLLVIEVKKLSGHSTLIDSTDEKKLRAFLNSNQLNYEFGLALQIPVGGSSTAKLFWFEQGARKQLYEEYNMGNDG